MFNTDSIQSPTEGEEENTCPLLSQSAYTERPISPLVGETPLPSSDMKNI
jgi:hypothetical protein